MTYPGPGLGQELLKVLINFGVSIDALSTQHQIGRDPDDGHGAEGHLPYQGVGFRGQEAEPLALAHMLEPDAVEEDAIQMRPCGEHLAEELR